LNFKLEVEYFNKMENELFNVDADVQTILRGHLYCEESLARQKTELIKAFIKILKLGEPEDDPSP